MNVRTNYGLAKVSDKYKNKLAKVKRDAGTEAIDLRLNQTTKKVEVYCFYTGLLFTMKIIK